MNGEPLLYPQAAIGYRAWMLDDGSLLGPYSREPWVGPALRASCSKDPTHSCPEPDCECGIYAYWELDEVDEIFGMLLPRLFSGNPEIADRFFVRGAVAGRGNALVHNDGFRIEEAEIVALFVSERQQQGTIGEQLRESLGVPLFSEREEFISHALRAGGAEVS